MSRYKSLFLCFLLTLGLFASLGVLGFNQVLGVVQGDLIFVSSWDGNLYRVDILTGDTLVIPAGLAQPEDVAVNSKGQVYVTEVGVPRITRFEMDGSGRTVIPLPFCCPEGSSFDAQDNLYFNTNEPHLGVYRILGGDPNNPPVQVIPPFASRGEGTNFLPNGDLLAVDFSGVVIRSSPPSFGAFSVFASTVPVQLIGIDADTTGRVCVTEREPSNRVSCFDNDGTPLGVLATGFNVPRHAEFDSQGNFYVGNFLGNNVIKITAQGQTSVVAQIFRAHGIGILHRTTRPLSVAKFYTDSNLNPLPLDWTGNPKVDVVLANGRVMSTNPGQVLAWVNITNIGGASLRSLKLNETLPMDWSVHPPWTPAAGAVHVFFVFANGTRLEITDPTSITVSSGNPQTVSLSIADLTSTASGKSLDPGEGALLSVKLTYSLIGTSQSASSYPRNYTDTAGATGWTGASFSGSQSSGSGSAFFLAFAKVVGDVDGNFRVDILDASALAYSYGTKPGDSQWSFNADFDNNGVIDVLDASQLASYYGTSS